MPLGKAYMTTPDYVYFGTLLSLQSVESVTRGTEPRTQNRGVSEQKTTRELKVIAKLAQGARGPHREQFSELRTVDALAACSRNWSHFADSGGISQPRQLWLPLQLARQMRSDGRRLLSGCLQSLQSADPAPLLAERSDVPKVQQKAHTGRAVYGFVAGAAHWRARTDRREVQDTAGDARVRRGHQTCSQRPLGQVQAGADEVGFLDVARAAHHPTMPRSPWVPQTGVHTHPRGPLVSTPEQEG